jgi:disulfide bond formation protein DsbB
MGSLFKGPVGLVLALVVVAALVVVYPAYRWILLACIAISIGIGIAVAAILHLWHKFRPLKEQDVDFKRPLGL